MTWSLDVPKPVSPCQGILHRKESRVHRMGIAQLGDLHLSLESPEQRNVIPPFGGNDQQRIPDDSNPFGANGRKRIHATRISQILKTHQYLSEPQKTIFWDDNIAGDMEYAKALFRAIAPYRKWWSSQASIHAGRDDEFLEAAAHSGCMQLFLGLESISQQSMTEMNNRNNSASTWRTSVSGKTCRCVYHARARKRHRVPSPRRYAPNRAGRRVSSR